MNAAQLPPSPLPSAVNAMLNDYCVKCHDADMKKGELDLTRLGREEITSHPDEWEKVVRKLQARQMPPSGKKRPEEKVYQNVVAQLASRLDRAAEKNPNPGRTDTFRRLNRTEYQNAIRDLLALDIDAAALLPKDDASHGFDNVGAANLSPTLLNRYISAAESISRLAIGAPRRAPGGDTYRTQPDLTQEEHVEGLPLGTRGGMLIQQTFPRDGEYEIQIRLTRDRNEHVEGMRESHELEVLIDRERVAHFTVSPPKGENHEKVDAHLKARIPVKAGPHQVGVTFVKNPSSLLETKRQPYQAHYNMHRHPRIGPAIYQVSINGPYNATGPGETPSRRRIFTTRPAKPQDEEACARQILTNLTRRAYRRPVTEADLEKPMEFYRQAKAADGFEAGIEAALSAVLVSPEFLFRIERDPASAAPGTAYQLNDVDLASRLSFFLWSSIPDDELLESAERGDLHKPKILEKQTRRMLADPRAKNLVSNFGEQWLHLRNLESITPDLRLFPDFDDNLRQAFRRETELHFETVLHEDRSVLDLLKGGLYLPERAARQALRHPARLWQPVSARGARPRQRARRPAAAGQRSHGDFLRHAHVADDSRQMDFGKHLRHSAAPAAGQRAGAEGKDHFRIAARAAAPGRASGECRVRRLPQPDRSARLRAGELRCHRPLAHDGRRRARGRERWPSGRRASSPVWPRWRTGCCNGPSSSSVLLRRNCSLSLSVAALNSRMRRRSAK